MRNSDGTWDWILDATDGSADSGVVTIEVVDSTGVSIVTDITFDLIVNPLAPTVTPATFSVAENSDSKVVVGTVTASDAADDPFEFSITSGNEAGGFAIDADSGQITVLNSGALDFETNPTFTLTVTATDDERSGSASVVINLVKKEVQRPTIADQTFNIDENQTSVGAVAGS